MFWDLASEVEKMLKTLRSEEGHEDLEKDTLY